MFVQLDDTPGNTSQQAKSILHTFVLGHSVCVRNVTKREGKHLLHLLQIVDINAQTHCEHTS